MSDLAPRFLCIGEMADSNPRLLAHASGRTGRADEIRPPRPDERGSVVAARNWLSAESITLALGVALGLAFVAGFVLFRDAHLKGKSIDNKRSSATGAAQFLDDT
jgi:hypothetical protein